MARRKSTADGANDASSDGAPVAVAKPRHRIAQRTVLRFVLLFGALVIPFTVYFFEFFSQGSVFERYLEWNARVSAALLRLASLQGNSASRRWRRVLLTATTSILILRFLTGRRASMTKRQGSPLAGWDSMSTSMPFHSRPFRAALSTALSY